MNWIARLLIGKEFGRCPRCQAMEATRICSLVGWRMAGAKVETVEIGARYSCQRCGHIYAVGPAGVFAYHAEALPPSPRWAEVPVREAQRTVVPAGGPMREEPLIPRARPVP
jgi:uncharacterized C2H2 Zn-finger protein